MVTIYSTPTCAPCRVAKSRLERAGVPYTEVDLSAPEHAETLAALKVRQQTATIQTPLIEHAGEIHTIAGLSAVIAAATQ